MQFLGPVKAMFLPKIIEGVHGIRPLVTFDVRSNSPSVS